MKSAISYDPANISKSNVSLLPACLGLISEDDIVGDILGFYWPLVSFCLFLLVVTVYIYNQTIILGGETLTDQDKKKWDSKYLENMGNSNPSKILKKYISLASGKNALDIACGNGRNSRYLAQKGFQVDAVDISSIAMNHLKDKNTGINIICQDLDTWQIPENRYQLIINIRFMDRRLFPMIQKGLKPGGVLIFESFIDENKEYSLKPNELLHAFRSFHVVYYEERKAEHHDKFDQSVYFVAIRT